MFETQLTLVGHLASDVKFALSSRPDGEEDLSIARFRVASTSRKFDKAQEIWVSGDTTFATVVCFRRLAEHVTSSLKRGDPVLVQGKMRMRSWQGENRSGTDLEIIAAAVGHNLFFGTSMFSKSLFRVPPDSAEPGAEEPFSPVAEQAPADTEPTTPMAEVTPLPGVSDIRSVGAVDASGVLPTRPREEMTSPHPTSSDPSTTADEQAA
jgi:single-strand DNA-binding protein